MVGLLGDALACFEGDNDLDLLGEEMWTGLELEDWLEAAAETGMTQNSDSLRNFGSSTFFFGWHTEIYGLIMGDKRSQRRVQSDQSETRVGH